MVFISTRFGFVAKLTPGMDFHGNSVLKVQHCIDVRDALPFANRGEAEKAYRKTSMAGFWHCVLSSLDSDICSCPSVGPASAGKGPDRKEV